MRVYKVYMGLIIKGTIPRVPAFSLWNHLISSALYVFKILYGHRCPIYISKTVAEKLFRCGRHSFCCKVQLGPWVWPHDSEETPDAAWLFEGRHLAFTSFCEIFKVENLESKKTLIHLWEIKLVDKYLWSRRTYRANHVATCPKFQNVNVKKR